MTIFTLGDQRAVGHLTPPEAGEDLTVATMDARQADSVVDLMGVNLKHTGVYATCSLPQMTADLQYLGVRHVRVGRHAGTTPSTAALAARQTAVVGAVNNAGAKVVVILDDRGTDTPQTRLDHAIANWPTGVIEAVEGDNEPNNGNGWTPVTWPDDAPTDVESRTADIDNLGVNELWRRVNLIHQATRNTSWYGSSVPVLLSSLAIKGQMPWITRLSARKLTGGPGGEPGYFNAISEHLYQQAQRFPRGGMMGRMVSTYDTEFGAQYGAWLTETGFHNDLTDTSGHIGIPEAAAGCYMASFPFEAHLNGIDRMYVYEYLNDSGRPAGRERFFGQFFSPGNPKPAAVALHNIGTLFNDPGSSFTTTPLRVRITSTRTDLRSALYQKRDGTWLLALWRHGSRPQDPAVIWDWTTKTLKASPATALATVQFSKSRTVTATVPITGAAAKDQAGVNVTARAGTVVALPLAEHAVVLHIT